MAFADEPTPYAGRRFLCGWSERSQTATDIAAQVQQLACRLGAIYPEFGLIRPDPGMRKFRPGDLGPVVEMTTAQLAELIERRGRFDPPRFPAPVSSQGYQMLYRNDLLALSRLSVTVSAGAFEYGASENGIRVHPDDDHLVWRELERGIQVLQATVEVWGAEWACAYALKVHPPVTRMEGPSPKRPWLAWTAEPLRPRPNPPYHRPYPGPLPFDDADPPAEVRLWRGGELQIWP